MSDGNPTLSKEDKMKQINQKLNDMMLKKGINLSESLVKTKQIPKQSQKKDNEIQEKQIEEKRIQKTKKIKKQPKQNGNLRKAAGLVWEDKTMEDWPQNDYRIFVGNLGNEVSDEILSTAFRTKYASFNMARVVRDRRTGKTRGYGFVSFSNSKDFLSALKEMNGKYVGNRPVKVTKSSWKDRDLNSEKNAELPSDFKTNSKKETHKICPNFKYVNPY